MPLPPTARPILLGLMVAAAALWYVALYDTAEAKCTRGDLGACTVWAARQASAGECVAYAPGIPQIAGVPDCAQGQGLITP